MGVYANYFEIGYNAVEYVLDFGQKYSDEAVCMDSRIIMSPVHAKLLAEMLSNSVDQYQTKFSAINPMWTSK
jgi:hypothetical protein